MYAQKLLDAGYTVHVKDYKGACHGHMMMAVNASIGGLKFQNGLDAIDDLYTCAKFWRFCSKHLRSAST